MTGYYHNTSLDSLGRIKSSGYLQPPVFVTEEGYSPVFISDLTLKLDLRGFQLRKDPHPGVGKGHYYVGRKIPVSRILDIDVRLDTLEGLASKELLPLPGRHSGKFVLGEIEDLLGDPVGLPRKSIVPEASRAKLVIEE